VTNPKPLQRFRPDESPESDFIVGSGPFTYRANDQWVQRPAEYSWQEVSAVAVDSSDNVFVFNRGDHPVMVFDRDGKFLRSWGPGGFARAHGITIGPDDAVYCSDDLDHTSASSLRMEPWYGSWVQVVNHRIPGPRASTTARSLTRGLPFIFRPTSHFLRRATST
jgi:hypothetical protein